MAKRSAAMERVLDVTHRSTCEVILQKNLPLCIVDKHFIQGLRFMYHSCNKVREPFRKSGKHLYHSLMTIYAECKNKVFIDLVGNLHLRVVPCIIEHLRWGFTSVFCCSENLQHAPQESLALELRQRPAMHTAENRSSSAFHRPLLLCMWTSFDSDEEGSNDARAIAAGPQLPETLTLNFGVCGNPGYRLRNSPRTTSSQKCTPRQGT